MRFAVLLSLLVLVSCSSAKKRAIELSEKGQFEESVAEFEKALKDDPKDAEALEGMKNAQEMAINNRLVQLRNFRSSNEHARALNALKEIVDLEKKWNFRPDVNSATFQGKEAALLWNPFKTEVTARIQKGHALSAAALYLDFKDIFSFTPRGELEGERARIFAAGKKSCRAFKDFVTYPYLSSFHNRYCEYFGVDKKSKVTYTNVFSSFEWNNFLQGTTDSTNKHVLIGQVATAFSQTPWFSQFSKAKMPLTINGKFSHEVTSETVHQVQEYYESEPYTAHEQVKKTRTNSLGQVEEYYESESVTRYRSVRKEFAYSAKKLSQKIVFNFKAEFELVKKKHSLDFDKDFSESIIVHDYNMPQIDLHPPKRKNLESVPILWEKYSTEIATAMKQKLISVWETEYCVLPETRTHASVAENVLRCRKSSAAKSGEFVNTWFQNNYGASNAVAERVLGDF
jgi:hypothetical protein